MVAHWLHYPEARRLIAGISQLEEDDGAPGRCRTRADPIETGAVQFRLHLNLEIAFSPFRSAGPKGVRSATGLDKFVFQHGLTLVQGEGKPRPGGEHEVARGLRMLQAQAMTYFMGQDRTHKNGA